MRELGEGQFGKVLLMKTEVIKSMQIRGTDKINEIHLQGIAGYEQPLPVAVKTITSTDPEVVKNFRQEAELMKKFCHPNIVSLLGKSMCHHVYMRQLLLTRSVNGINFVHT